MICGICNKLIKSGERQARGSGNHFSCVYPQGIECECGNCKKMIREFEEYDEWVSKQELIAIYDKVTGRCKRHGIEACWCC